MASFYLIMILTIYKRSIEHAIDHQEADAFYLILFLFSMLTNISSNGLYRLVQINTGVKDPLNIYSILKLFTGLARADFIAWKLTVISAIKMATEPAITNIHHETGARYS